jgi:hypothetical protein
LEKKAAIADFEAARQEWIRAFERVPDGALGFLKDGDDYALGGLQVHVNWVLNHYRRVLAGMVQRGIDRLPPQDGPNEAAAAVAKAKAGITAGERAGAMEEMGRLHQGVLAVVNRLPVENWARKAEVVYGNGQDPYPTSPQDIVGWLRDHYREHVGQSADLTAEWKLGQGSEPG